MYSILIVDDEQNIRDGIAKGCNWAQFQIDCVNTACNGLQALEIMQQMPVDLVITDVKMPGMTGLEFLKIASQQYPQARFAVLSGYDEFEFARMALKYNAKEYILKPCSVEEIHEVVQKLVAELDAQKSRTQQELHYQHMQAHMRENLIGSYILSELEDAQQWSDELAVMRHTELRLLLMQLAGSSHEKRHAVQALAGKLLGRRHLIFCSRPAGNNLLLCIEYSPYPALREQLLLLQAQAEQIAGKLTIVVGEKTDFAKVQASYRNILDCMNAAFYKGEGSIISTFDRLDQDQIPQIGDLKTQDLLSAIRSADTQGTTRALEALYETFNNRSNQIAQVRSRAFGLLLAISKIDAGEQSGQDARALCRILESRDLDAVMCILRRAAAEKIEQISSQRGHRSQQMISRVEEYVEAHLADAELSLSQIAREVLFVNAAYLGKLFMEKKQQKFSDYVKLRRMDRAKELLGGSDLLIKDISLQTGFGYNTQYFSRVFKETTGQTPKGYRKHAGRRT